jgi:hypothetical protein
MPAEDIARLERHLAELARVRDITGDRDGGSDAPTQRA